MKPYIRIPHVRTCITLHNYYATVIAKRFSFGGSTGFVTYRRVRIKRPWVGNLRMQRKRGVGAKCVVRRKWHVVSAHHHEKADKSLFLL